MALIPASVLLIREQGETTARPSFIHRFTIPGDAAYATGGSLFAATMTAVSEQSVTVNAVHGWGFTAGAITHIPVYVSSTGRLLVYVLATGAQAANAADLSAVTFDLTVISE